MHREGGPGETGYPSHAGRDIRSGGNYIVPGVTYAIPKSYAEPIAYNTEDKRRSDPYDLYSTKLSKNNCLPVLRQANLSEACRVPSLSFPEITVEAQGDNDTEFPSMRIILAGAKPNPEVFVAEFKRR